MLQYAGRNLRQLKALLKKYGEELTVRQRRVIKKRLRVLETIFKQQWAMWKAKSHQMKDRIVSLHLPHIRPMVRGKDGRDVEFGPKALLSWVDGFCFLDYFSFDAYNEALHAGRSLRKYKERFGHLPAVSIGDGIFGNRENRRKLDRLGVLNAFKPFGPYLDRAAIVVQGRCAQVGVVLAETAEGVNGGLVEGAPRRVDDL